MQELSSPQSSRKKEREMKEGGRRICWEPTVAGTEPGTVAQATSRQGLKDVEDLLRATGSQVGF